MALGFVRRAARLGFVRISPSVGFVRTNRQGLPRPSGSFGCGEARVRSDAVERKPSALDPEPHAAADHRCLALLGC
jgi:hypothetical protein